MLSRMPPRVLGRWPRTFPLHTHCRPQPPPQPQRSAAADKSPVPEWLQDLEKKQAALPSSSPAARAATPSNRQRELDDQIIIYEAVLRDDFYGSPTRIGLGIIGLLVTSGLVANQIRHHGAGPAWPDPQSAWLDFELKLWDKSTRIAVAVSLITFSIVKSLKLLFTLSHTIKRITIKKSHLGQLKQLVSSKKNKPALMALLPLTFYSVGALDLMYPIRCIFRFSILEAIRAGDLLRLSRPIATQTAPGPQRALWLKFAVDPSAQPPPTSSAPVLARHPELLNSFALQIPAVGVWGNAKFGLSPWDILALFEDKIQSVDNLSPKSTSRQGGSAKGGRSAANAEEDQGLLHRLSGPDFRHSLGFNLAVLKAHLTAHSRRLASPTSA